MQDRPNPIWLCIAGGVLGMVLTYLYVWFGFELPGVIRIGETIASEAAVAAAEAKLYDPAAPRDVRARALAVVVGEKPELFLDVDQTLGHAFFEEVIRRKALRKAKLMKHRLRAYEMALDKPALRRMYEKRHGVTETEALKRSMFIADIQRDALLHAFLRRHHPEASADELAEIVLDAYRNGLKRGAAPAVSADVQRPAAR